MHPLRYDASLTRRSLLQRSGYALVLVSAGGVLPVPALAAPPPLSSERRASYEALIDALDGTGTPGVDRLRAADAAETLASLYAGADRDSQLTVNAALDALDPQRGVRFSELDRAGRLERLGEVLPQSEGGKGTLGQIAVGLAVGPFLDDDFALDKCAPSLEVWDRSQARYAGLRNAPRESAPAEATAWSQREDW